MILYVLASALARLSVPASKRSGCQTNIISRYAFFTSALVTGGESSSIWTASATVIVSVQVHRRASCFLCAASTRIPKERRAGCDIDTGPNRLGEMNGTDWIEKQRQSNQEPPHFALFCFPSLRKCPHGPRANNDAQELIVAVWQRQRADEGEHGYYSGKSISVHVVQFSRAADSRKLQRVVNGLSYHADDVPHPLLVGPRFLRHHRQLEFRFEIQKQSAAEFVDGVAESAFRIAFLVFADGLGNRASACAC